MRQRQVRRDAMAWLASRSAVASGCRTARGTTNATTETEMKNRMANQTPEPRLPAPMARGLALLCTLALAICLGT